MGSSILKTQWIGYRRWHESPQGHTIFLCVFMYTQPSWFFDWAALCGLCYQDTYCTVSSSCIIVNNMLNMLSVMQLFQCWVQWEDVSFGVNSSSKIDWLRNHENLIYRTLALQDFWLTDEVRRCLLSMEKTCLCLVMMDDEKDVIFRCDHDKCVIKMNDCRKEQGGKILSEWLWAISISTHYFKRL